MLTTIGLIYAAIVFTVKAFMHGAASVLAFFNPGLGAKSTAHIKGGPQNFIATVLDLTALAAIIFAILEHFASK